MAATAPCDARAIVNPATRMENQPVFVDLCARCGGAVLHWYEQSGLAQAIAPMASDPLVQGGDGDHYVECPHCGAENATTSTPATQGYGARQMIIGLRPQS